MNDYSPISEDNDDNIASIMIDSFEEDRLRAINNQKLTCPTCKVFLKIDEIYYVSNILPDENLNKPNCPICYEQFYPSYSIKFNCCQRFVHINCLKNLYCSIFKCNFDIIDYNYYYQFNPSESILQPSHDELLYNAENKINELKSQINILYNDLYYIESNYNYAKQNLDELKICYQDSEQDKNILFNKNILLENYNKTLLSEIEILKMKLNDKKID